MWTILRFPRTARLPSSLLMGLASIAVVGASSSSSSFRSAACEDASEKKVALSPKEFRTFKVRKVEALTHDVKRITFDLPGEDYEMGLPTASCLLSKAKINGKVVIRPYTPTNLNTETGFLELVVKGYPTGLMSKHIVELKEGDDLELKGPFIKLKYEANKWKKLGLIAGGSGITPMLQLIKQICRDPKDQTEIVLIFGNRTEQDIILRDELDALQYLYPQLKVHYVLSEPDETWTGLKGFVSKELITELLPGPSDDHLICVCGPPPMMFSISGDKAKDKTQGELQGALKELQYTSKQVFKF